MLLYLFWKSKNCNPVGSHVKMNTPAFPKNRDILLDPQECYKFQWDITQARKHTVHTLMPTASNTDFADLFIFEGLKGIGKKCKGIQWPDLCSNKREGQLRYNTKLFLTANENKIPSFIGSKWFTPALPLTQKMVIHYGLLKELMRRWSQGKHGAGQPELPHWPSLRPPQLREHPDDQTHLSRF